ncbi:VanZ family protein [Neobacillus drentensis]|uniref:VanZ family protein n=1 Tax=Neobacillus drentensis TaxID=220684 RepID=UPI0028679079|nr:VanZ family protein [Neobacillus drentensis]MDR7236659.1 glycopeptide antibiotics resistance protein [Neobacillus drentensis]
MRKTSFLSLLISSILFIVFSPVFIRLVAYLHPIVLAVIMFGIVCFVFVGILFIRKETINLSLPFFVGLLALYTIALLILLFFRPSEQSYNSMNLQPFSTISFYLSGKENGLISFYNLAANVCLFIPYGIYIGLKSYSLLKAFLVPLVIIAFIEVLQYVTHRGSLDIDDLILNLFGVILGNLLFPIFKKIIIVSSKN